MIYINEIFYSLQGEGQRTGNPSVFIRTGLCNFNCQGFGVEYEVSGEMKIGCDSYMAVDSSFTNTWKKYKNYLSIVTDINSQVPNTFRTHSKSKVDIVLTGGEPLLHWNNPIYQNLINHYISRGHKVTIETNSALDIDFTQDYQKNIIFSASVKLKSSGEPKNKRINIKTLNKIFLHTNNSFLKLVTSKKTWESDINEINYLLDNISTYINIYLMPLGDNQSKLNQNSQFVFEQAMKLGLNYSDRTHIRIYNDKVGV